MTGASGFCGGAVARLLVGAGSRRRRARPTCPPAVGEWRRWDAATDVPDLGGCDAVVHLAAAVGDPRPGTDEPEFERVNVGGAERLLLATAGRTVVRVSSSSVYDPRLDRSCVAEDHPTAIGAPQRLRAHQGRRRPARPRRRRRRAPAARRLRPGRRPPAAAPAAARCAAAACCLPGPDVELSLTHVDNLATACVAALDWAPGRLQRRRRRLGEPRRDPDRRPVGGPRPAGRRRPPAAAASSAGRPTCSRRAARLAGREPLLTPYAVDTLAHHFVPRHHPGPRHRLVAGRRPGRLPGRAPRRGPAVGRLARVPARLRRADAAEVAAALARVDAGTAERADLKLLVKHFLALLEEQAPGRSVEVRVPPYAAVQVIAGGPPHPRHPARRRRDRRRYLHRPRHRCAHLGRRRSPGPPHRLRRAHRPLALPAALTEVEA